MNPTPGEVTRMLEQWGKGDRAALDQLVPLVYRELHKIAKQYMAHQEPGHTFQTTALIHEAYLKLVGTAPGKQWKDRAHFFGVAAKAMRHLLVDHGRAGGAAKRGGAARMIRLEEGLNIPDRFGPDLVALNDALDALAKLSPRQAEVVELRYFAGLSVEETAAVLNLSRETVMRDWGVAKAYLQRELKARSADDAARKSLRD
jgi:RNA polymerase sigma factor (TIGR02999 family)